MPLQLRQLRSLVVAILLCVASLVWATSAEAATITVCASGCTQPASAAGLQAAIDAAVSGDTILLQTNFTFVGAFLLRKKACAAGNDTCYVTIKTGVTSTAGVMSSGLFPAANVRTDPSYTSVYAKIQPLGSNVTAFRTVYPAETSASCAAAPCVASYWRLQNLEIISNSYGGSTLVDFGTQGTSGAMPASDTQDNASEEPHHLQMVQVYMHGSPSLGQERCMLIAARDVTIQDSYFIDTRSIADKACIWSDNSTGNITITNNFIRAGSENIIFGGDVPRMNTNTTVLASPTPTTTVFALASVKDYLHVGDAISVVLSGVIRTTTVTNIAGATLTVVALPSIPATGAAVNYSVVPRNATISKNWLSKDPAWRNPMISTPQSVSAAGSITGGTLAAGTYAYKVTARMISAGNQIVRSTASVEVTGTVVSGTTGKVTVSWDPVANATEYYLYGRNSGAENVRYVIATSACTGSPTRCTAADTNAAGTSEAVPSTAGNTSVHKNLFEIKKYNTMTVEGNLMEYSWQSGGQAGFAVLMTPANNSVGVNGNDSTVIKDITFQKNRIRHAAAAFQIAGRSADGDVSDRTSGVSILHNVWEDIGTAWGISENLIIITTNTNAAYLAPEKRGPLNTLINHNTFLNAQGKSTPLFDLFKSGEAHLAENFDFTNNILRKVTSGLRALNVGGTMGEGQVSWAAATDSGTSLWSNNIVVGASCSVYPGTPASTWCPSEATFQSIFTNYGAGDFHVTGSWLTAATDGGPVGADLTLIDPLTAIAVNGDNSGGTIINPPTITTLTLANGAVGVSYTASVSATGGTSPYTWAVVSPTTLPTGLSLNTSTGAITGIPTDAGPVTFTIRATGANTGTTTQSYTVNINNVVSTGNRPDRVDYMEVAIFRRDVDPDCVLDQVRVGDLYYNVTTDVIYKATATSPSCVWTTIAPVTGASRSGLFSSDSVTPAGWALTTTAGELYSNVGNRVRIDLTGMTQCKIWGRLSTAVPNATLTMNYVVTDGGTFATTNVTANLSTDFGTQYFITPSYVTIPAGAQTEVWLQITGQMSSGTASPVIRNMGFVCKP